MAPIQNVIDGTRAVAHGDLDTQLPLPGSDDMGFLVRSFNDMTRRLSDARELASRNITVNAVAPGYIDTDMTGGLNEKAKAAMIGQIPMSRIGTPADVSGVVAFLASPAADYITGQVIFIDGGYTAF